MALRCLPIISSYDYARFQQLMPLELRATYTEWLIDLQREKLAIMGNGDVYLLVDVDPDRFSTYCSRNGAACSLEELRRFAWRSGHVDR